MGQPLLFALALGEQLIHRCALVAASSSGDLQRKGSFQTLTLHILLIIRNNLLPATELSELSTLIIGQRMF